MLVHTQLTKYATDFIPVDMSAAGWILEVSKIDTLEYNDNSKVNCRRGYCAAVQRARRKIYVNCLPNVEVKLFDAA